jgi:hypothetical protein
VEKIGEPVDVLALFTAGRIRPYAFRWNNRRYPVEKVNLVYTARDGLTRLFYFAVSSGATSYKLCFNASTMRWELEELYQ